MPGCIEKIECPKCGGHSLQVFQNDDGGYTGFCFSNCGFDPDPYRDKPPNYKPVAIRKTKEQIAEDIAEVLEYQFLALPDRKLKKEYLEYYGVRVGVSH